MKINIKSVIIFLLIVIVIIFTYIYFNKGLAEQIILKNKFFYEPEEISPDLEKIDDIKHEIYDEVMKVYNEKSSTKWQDWPEKNLYERSGTWKIFPFYGFGIWNDDAIEKCPILAKYLKNLKGLKLATLSKLSSGMKLTKHRGWGNHSNHVIRCHYGLVVPEGCYIAVGDIVNKNGKYIEKKQYHKKFTWTTFDDSKDHYAENTSDQDRIVLIIDMARPKDIEIGKSTIGDSKELIEIVKYFNDHNKK